MRFPDLPTRLVALRERYDVDYSALSQHLKVDKTTVWRWFQGAANLPEPKQQALVGALCALLPKAGASLCEDDFRLNNSFEFFGKLGISKLRAALLTGVSLPVPESLIDSALAPQEPLHAFVGHYVAYWDQGGGVFARCIVVLEKQPDGRVTLRLEWNGSGAFTVEAFVCLIGEELSVLGDRIAGNFKRSRGLFAMNLDVDFDQRTNTVKGLYGYLPDRVNVESVMRRFVMVPTKLDEVDGNDSAVDLVHVKERAGPRGVAFLTADMRAA